jgi:hypothetical protein
MDALERMPLIQYWHELNTRLDELTKAKRDNKAQRGKQYPGSNRIRT